MMPNIGFSGSASSGAEAISGQGDMVVGGGGSGIGGGKYGWLVWVAGAIVVLLFLLRRKG